MRTQELAPAKINLALDILGRRADGYHELRMVMQTVSLCDVITVEEGGTGFTLLTGEAFSLPADKVPMEQRAAEAFFAALGVPVPPLTVRLEKNIPAFAGLGGGSADVAALLRCLRRLYAAGMPDEALRAIGLTVGSDVPFCVSGGTSLAEGRGERLTDLPPLPVCQIVLCKPDFGISTPELFVLADGAVLSKRPDIAGLTAALQGGELTGVTDRLCNVFEEFLPERYQEVFRIKEILLAHGALNAAMSGSGPTVYGIFESAAEAQRAAEVLKKSYQQTYVAKPVKKLV